MSDANGGRTAMMGGLIRTSGSTDGDDGPRTRVLVVRQAARSVRPEDSYATLALRLMIGVLVTVGVIFAAWVMGALGTRLGFVPLMRLTAMDSSISDGLAAAVWTVTSLPGTIIRAGIEHPLLLILGYMLIAIPGASLAGVRTVTPGGPKPHVLSQVFSYGVAVGCVVQACVLIWWVGASFRNDLIQSIPTNTAEMHRWFTSLRVAAGLDFLALIIASLWVVLIMRVAIAAWLRALCAPAAFAALVVVFLGMSITNTTVAQLLAHRSIVASSDEHATSRLWLGSTEGRMVSLSSEGEKVVIQVVQTEQAKRITGTASILDFLAGGQDSR